MSSSTNTLWTVMVHTSNSGSGNMKSTIKSQGDTNSTAHYEDVVYALTVTANTTLYAWIASETAGAVASGCNVWLTAIRIK